MLQRPESWKSGLSYLYQPAATWILGNRNRASDYVVSSFGMGTWDVSCAFDLSDDGNTGV